MLRKEKRERGEVGRGEKPERKQSDHLHKNNQNLQTDYDNYRVHQDCQITSNRKNPQFPPIASY